ETAPARGAPAGAGAFFSAVDVPGGRWWRSKKGVSDMGSTAGGGGAPGDAEVPDRFARGAWGAAAPEARDPPIGDPRTWRAAAPEARELPPVDCAGPDMAGGGAASVASVPVMPRARAGPSITVRAPMPASSAGFLEIDVRAGARPAASSRA